MTNLTKLKSKALSFISKVIRDNRRHITRADYGDNPVSLSSGNVIFPKVGSLQSRVLRMLLPAGRTVSHREFDSATCSYRLGGFVGFLRDKGWTIVNHDEVAKTNDIVPRSVLFTRYELFAVFTPELKQRIEAFCEAVYEFERRAAEAKAA